MKTKHIPLSILLVLPSLAGVSTAQQHAPVKGSPQPAAAYTERITESELVRLREQSKPFVSSSAEQSVAPPTASANFADTTDFISFGGLTTFVPKGAVLHVPDRIREYMTAGGNGKLVFWGTFLTRFPAVVEPFEVTIQEAAGIKKINPDRLAAAMRSERIIVTVIQGNPTSTHKYEDRNPAP